MLTTRYYPVAGITEPEHATPAKTGQASGDNPPPYMDPHERMRLRAAAFRATQVHPGPVGELLSRELMAWEEVGFRFTRGTLPARLVEHLMTTELPRP